MTEKSSDIQSPSSQTDDAVFRQEQAHLGKIYQTLQELGRNLVRKMNRVGSTAAEDKESMAEEVGINLATQADAMETYADFEAVNQIIDAYNLMQDADAERLSSIEILLKQPYFAKIVLQFDNDDSPKELYIGTTGISDENYRRLVVDWRSPVAEVYYNQDNGPTSYEADGRTIHTNLKLRRQFDIEEDKLNAYFDTTVAIQDSLLLASLSKRHTAQMQAITATIQKEQNLVVRHQDVPTLLVSGIAGSGKTSVLLQRIAYLFYQNRGKLDAREVFLITPNPLFRSYISDVLPDLGERNPVSFTWDEIARLLLPPKRVMGDTNIPLAALKRIDEVCANFEFEANDFRDIAMDGVRLIGADQISRLSTKYQRIPAGPHRITLMREELFERLGKRLNQMAQTEEAQNDLAALSYEEQLRIFNETVDPQDEEEAISLTLRYLHDRFEPAYTMIKTDDWLRIDRIGMRLLDVESITSVEWIYLKMVLTGLSNPQAKYVMIDEVQDYTAAQLVVLARFFRRAHFMLLGDPNQAIIDEAASFDEIRTIFNDTHGPVEECHLMTSYRSTPEITRLFASLLSTDERMSISSIQRADTPPAIKVLPDEKSYVATLWRTAYEARENDGLTAIIVPWKEEAKRLGALLSEAGNTIPVLVDDTAVLPSSGLVLITLKLAKGLEFDHVIIPDASARIFPDDPLSRRRLYTAISRATYSITILAQGELSPLLAEAVQDDTSETLCELS